MQHERGVELTAVHGSRGVFQIARKIERKDVDRENPGSARAQRGQRLLMRIVAVRGENNESVHAALLPGAKQIIHPAVERLAANGGVPGVGPFRRGVHAVRYRGGAQHLIACGEVVRESFDDERIAAQRKVRPVLLAGADGDQQP